MTKYDTLTAKLSNSQFHKLKSRAKNGTEITLNLLSNVIGDSNNETNLLTDAQVSRIRKVFGNGSSPNTIFSKTQLSKIVHSGGFSGLDLGCFF